MKDFVKEFKVALIIAMIALILVVAGCNRTPIDTTWSYDYAYIELPGGKIVEGKVESWKDFSDGDQIQVKINGKTYLAHSSKVVLVNG